MEKLLFIVNPKAGVKKSFSPLYHALSIFGAHDYLVNVHETTGRGDAIDFIRKVGSSYDTIVCVGGDGTLNETISGMMSLENPPLLGYLPCGSTNDFAYSLGLTTDLVSQAERITQKNIFPLDIGSFNERFFSYVASFGAFVKASYSASQSAKNLIGHLAYILEGMTDLSTLHPYHLKINADGETWDETFVFGGICSSTSLGGLVKLDPSKVSMDDGLFEMVLLKSPKTLLEFNELVGNLTRMKYDANGIVFRHVSHVEIETEDDVPWSLDGEYAPSCPKVILHNHHHALQILK